MSPSATYNAEFDHASAISREWLITNGIGGYASSTVIGENSRKYHGLLIASANPPVDRRVLLSSLDEEIMIGDEIYRLANHRYPNTLYPSGFEYLDRFSASPLPTFEYSIRNIRIIKTIFMIYGQNTTVVKYKLFNPDDEDIVFRIFPLVTNRNYHHLGKAGHINFGKIFYPKEIQIGTADCDLQLQSNMHYRHKPYWNYSVEYDIERERGEAYQEDLYNPGYFEKQIQGPSSELYVVASDSILKSKDIDQEFVNSRYQKELLRQKSLQVHDNLKGDFTQKLVNAADSFIVKRSSTSSRSIIAGYHWFADWGRDAMIALPGLTLVTGRFNDAKEILKTFSENCSGGLIPNRFSDDGISPPDYNTVDASLWFIHSLGRYYSYTKDVAFVGEMWKTVVSIIRNYSEGTLYGIRMDEDGLIEHDGQLTWMDVKIGDMEITPRAGKACEINALWYNALCTAIRLGKILGENTKQYQKIAQLAESNFTDTFWNQTDLCLYDCVSVNEDMSITKDAAVRPNQIFAVSLPYTMLNHEKKMMIVEKVKEDLLTPYGLRSLSPKDSRYNGRYRGDRDCRDHAYHNGTVWPWLLGPFITAHVKVNNRSPLGREYCRQLLVNFEAHLDEVGIGTISEVFDGDSPHRPGGCISQAWSVAEILRAYVEDVNV
ncbi:glycogen debranching enzyme N-terminal domain-containing protein [Methanococcoides orientis]|uniref:amylo-alpha-1,6-glucosidase n=1 Tax=Methanococcoides orientis TaxID=2822137 RepID=UPI001E644DD7|nr:amylo-alpha-1,6-glucosidase [Methanococcoides orientis]UGV41302.1 glycogen debranching enzyme N-terminal domain-containing protein [Methanococcoides orientis]